MDPNPPPDPGGSPSPPTLDTPTLSETALNEDPNNPTFVNPTAPGGYQFRMHARYDRRRKNEPFNPILAFKALVTKLREIDPTLVILDHQLPTNYLHPGDAFPGTKKGLSEWIEHEITDTNIYLAFWVRSKKNIYGLKFSGPPGSKIIDWAKREEVFLNEARVSELKTTKIGIITKKHAKMTNRPIFEEFLRRELYYYQKSKYSDDPQQHRFETTAHSAISYSNESQPESQVCEPGQPPINHYQR